jgi:hypothetical protein
LTDEPLDLTEEEQEAINTALDMVRVCCSEKCHAAFQSALRKLKQNSIKEKDNG